MAVSDRHFRRHVAVGSTRGRLASLLVVTVIVIGRGLGFASAAFAQTPSDQSEAARKAEQDCRTSLSCWALRHREAAAKACEARLPANRQAVRWAPGSAPTNLALFQWSDQARGTVTFFGDRLVLAVGAEPAVRHVYFCTYDTGAGRVLGFGHAPGALPQ